MTNDKLISIVIPNYNNERYLPKCLESCINQIYNNIEIIVVDDCSTDGSIQVIQYYQKKDSRIKLIQNKVNQKVSKTRDIGISKSQGRWITTLDSDDYYYSNNKIEKEVDIIRSYNFRENVIAYSGIVRVDNHGKKIGNVMSSKKVMEGDIFKSIITRSCAIPRDFIFSKVAYSKAGGFDFNIPMYEDWDLKLRLAKFCEYYFSGNWEGIAYRRHSSGLSSVSKQEHEKWLKYVFQKNSTYLANKLDLQKNLNKNTNLSIINRIINKIIKSL